MSETVQKKSHSLIFQILTPALAVLILALVIEIGLRLAGYNPLASLRQSDKTHSYYLRQSADPNLRYELNPGFRGKHVRNGKMIRINALGMRGREIDPVKEGKFRIAILGDSIAFGSEFDEGLIFPSRLEQKLRQKNTSVEVLNLGTEGYDTVEDVVRFRNVGLSLKPDVAVLCYTLNDIGITPLDFGYVKSFLQPRLPLWTHSRLAVLVGVMFRRIRLDQRLWKQMPEMDAFGERQKALYRPVPEDDFLKEQFRQIDEAQRLFEKSGTESHEKAVAEKSGRLWLNKYASLENLGKIRYAFNELKALADQNGFKVLVAIIPYFYKVDGVYVDIPAHRLIGREAELAGFKTVDLYETFDSAGLETMTTDSVHLNNQGHMVMAQALAEALNDWVPVAARTTTDLKKESK